MILAGILTFFAGLFICKCFAFGLSPLIKAVKIVIVILALSGIYAALNILFKMDYAKELLNRLKK